MGTVAETFDLGWELEELSEAFNPYVEAERWANVPLARTPGALDMTPIQDRIRRAWADDPDAAEKYLRGMGAVTRSVVWGSRNGENILESFWIDGDASLLQAEPGQETAVGANEDPYLLVEINRSQDGTVGGVRIFTGVPDADGGHSERPVLVASDAILDVLRRGDTDPSTPSGHGLGPDDYDVMLGLAQVIRAARSVMSPAA